MDAFTSKVQGVVDRLTTPEAMPFTIAGGVIVGAIASVGVWRAATAAYEGNLTELQRKLSKGVAQTASGKLLTITRASPSTTAGCATMIAAALVEEDDASLKAMCPEAIIPPEDNLQSCDLRLVDVFGGLAAATRRAAAANVAMLKRLTSPATANAHRNSWRGATSADRMARAQWLHSCLVSSLAPASTGALVLRADDASSGKGPYAVATVFPPGVDFPTEEFFWRGGWAYILHLTGWERRMRFPGLGETLRSHRQRLTRRFEGKVWYVMGAASDPAAGEAGEMALSAALAPVVEAADAAGRACYTETSSAATLRALKAQGFVAVEETRYAVFGVDVSILVRAPHVGGKPAFDVSLDTLRPTTD